MLYSVWVALEGMLLLSNDLGGLLCRVNATQEIAIVLVWKYATNDHISFGSYSVECSSSSINSISSSSNAGSDSVGLSCSTDSQPSLIVQQTWNRCIICPGQNSLSFLPI